MKELFIISGGQTGVDRAALDAALSLNLPCGGWCPSGRRAEDGPIPARYPLRELDSERYLPRTKMNVIDSHATLILTRGQLSGGTRTTHRLAELYNKPCLKVDLDGDEADLAVSRIRNWLQQEIQEVDERPFRLNIAGPRESTQPGIYAHSYSLLEKVWM